jgi:hypothetical protein
MISLKYELSFCLGSLTSLVLGTIPVHVLHVCVCMCMHVYACVCMCMYAVCDLSILWFQDICQAALAQHMWNCRRVFEPQHQHGHFVPDRTALCWVRIHCNDTVAWSEFLLEFEQPPKYAYIHTYIHTHTDRYISIYTYIYTYIQILTDSCKSYTYMHIQVLENKVQKRHVCTNALVCIYMCIYVYEYIHIHIHIHPHPHTYIHIHTVMSAYRFYTQIHTYTYNTGIHILYIHLCPYRHCSITYAHTDTYRQIFV